MKSKKYLIPMKRPPKQGINKHKTWIFFSANTHPILKRNILNLASVSLCNNQEKYLSLPIMVRKNRYQTFEAIKNRV